MKTFIVSIAILLFWGAVVLVAIYILSSTPFPSDQGEFTARLRKNGAPALAVYEIRLYDGVRCVALTTGALACDWARASTGGQ